MASISPSKLPPEDWAAVDHYLRRNNAGEYVDKNTDNKTRAAVLAVFASKFARDPFCYRLLIENTYLRKIVLAQPEFFNRHLYYFAHFLKSGSPVDPVINRDEMSAYERELNTILHLEVLAVEAHPEILTFPGALALLVENKTSALMLANRGNHQVAMAIARTKPVLLVQLAQEHDMTSDIKDEVFIEALKAFPGAANYIAASFVAGRPILLAYLREKGFPHVHAVEALILQREREQHLHD